MTARPRKALRTGLPITVGILGISALLGSVGAWSVGSRISGAVVATGVVEVESNRQVVQHPDGGVVGGIFAREGDLVEAGDVLVRFDETFLLSELAIVEGQLLEIFARRARLEAERDGATAPRFHPMPSLVTVDEVALQDQIEGQSSLFAARLASLAQQTRQIREQQQQIESQIRGRLAQRAAFDRQLALIESELADVQSLFEQGLVPTARLLGLQRTQASLEGDIGQLTAEMAEARGRIIGLSIEASALLDFRREEAIARLRDLSFNEGELKQRQLSLLEQRARLDVRAPVTGTVFETQVFAVQSVVRAAEPMMYIVPGAAPLQIAARIEPTDIDEVYAGQEVSVMFTAFNRRTTPEIRGTVLRVSAAAVVNETSGQSFYEAVILPDAVELAALEDVSIKPGMPVETFLKTEERSPMNYLTQPLTVYFQRAFREE